MGWKCFDHDRRVQLEVLVRSGHSKRECAALLGCHISTIYRELRRGRCEQLTSEWVTYYVYSPAVAHADAVRKRGHCGARLKLSRWPLAAGWIENKIIKEKWSPAVVSAELRRRFDLPDLSKDTIYRYVHGRAFRRLRASHLPEHGIRKHPWSKVTEKKAPRYGASIEERPPEILSRSELGHWEMDCVIGKSEGQGQALLVLTERQTRVELAFKLPAKNAAAVVEVVDRIQGNSDFGRLFKSITMDNGSEFADSYRLEHGLDGKRRTRCYYCHPYTSCERGSNENANRLIRRWFKKGKSLAGVTDQEARQVARWMNTYRRQLLGWDTPAERFLAACAVDGVEVSPWLMQYLQ